MTESTATTITSTRRQRRPGIWFLLTACFLLLTQVAHAAPRFMKVRVTFYSPSSRSKTATGRSARLPGVAVDPDVIPLGSRVAVPGFGVRVADDTGGAVKGNHIDVRLPAGNRAVARKHGVKHLRVRIVRATKATASARHHDEDETQKTRKSRLARARRAKAAKIAKEKAAKHARELKAKQAKALRAKREKREKAEKRRLRKERLEKLAQRKHALAVRAAKRRKQEERTKATKRHAKVRTRKR